MKKALQCGVVALLGLALFAGCKSKPKPRVVIPSSGRMAGAGISGGGLDETGIPLADGMEGLQFEEASAIVDAETGELIFEDVYFDYDDASIRESERVVLERIGGWMNSNPGVAVQIEGHCDERGSNEYNLALGERRSLGVRTYLSELGVSPDRVYTISYGEERPNDPGHHEEAWSKNRRGHFLISVQ